MKNLEVIALRRRGALYVPEKKSDKDVVTFGAFLQKLTNYGFYLDIADQAVVDAFNKGLITEEVLVSVVEALDYAYGVADDAVVLYPNFPLEVEETDELKLFVDALVYALSGFSLVPVQNDEYKRIAEEYTSKKDLRSLTVVSDADMVDIFWNLAESRTALSETDVSDIEVLLKKYGKEIVASAQVHEIPFKETMAKLVVEFGNLGLDARYLMKTPTDLLRVLQYMQEERTDLKGRFKLPTFSAGVKNLIATALDSMPFNVEDILRYKEEWKHIFNFATESKHTKNYKDYLYRNKKYTQGFYSQEDALFKSLNKSLETSFINIIEGEIVASSDVALVKYLDHLAQRPSELLRRVDKVLRLSLDDSELSVLAEYIEEAAAVSERRISYQLLNHLERRDNARGVYFGGSFHVLENLEALEEYEYEAVRNAVTAGLVRNFEGEEAIVVERAKNLDMVPVITSNRHSSESFEGLISGTRFKLPEGTNFFRMFSEWGADLRDVDLSVIALGEDFERISTCTYYNLKDKGLTHSGDVRRGPGAEYVDADVDVLRSIGAKYLFVQNYNYSGGEMHGVKTGVSLLNRGNKQKGSIHKASEVLVSSFHTSEKTSVFSLVVNLETMEVLWLDTPVEVGRYSNFEQSANEYGVAYKYYSADVLKVQEVLDLMHEAGVLAYKDELTPEELEDEELEVLILQEEKEDVFLTKHDLINTLLN